MLTVILDFCHKTLVKEWDQSGGKGKGRAWPFLPYLHNLPPSPMTNTYYSKV